MDDRQLRDEILQLTLAYQRGDASEEERARLERLLSDDTQAIVWYLRVVEDTLTLHDSTAAAETASTSGCEGAGCLLVDDATAEDLHGVGLAPLPRSPKFHNWLTVAVSLLLAVVGGGWIWWANGPMRVGAAQDSERQSAQVVNMSNVRWSEGAKKFDEWSRVHPGDSLKFETGLVKLFIANGVELLIKGPADVEFTSLERVLARRGKLAARVSPKAIGFRIDTPHANVIDRGTSFGVNVDENCRTAVVVYEGIVDLDAVGDRSKGLRRLATGEGLRVDRAGQLSRIFTVQSGEFLEPPLPPFTGPVKDRVINSVSDSVQQLETTKYYRVIPRGFREDCRSYVDRLHEWNGIDENGLPNQLVGGDYVMTFNDDKVATDMQIAVNLSQPANLYVLFDDRVPPPEWLTRDFVDTHWEVGADDGWEDKIIDNGVGPGDSIDHVCSVWKREVSEAGTVMLGALTPDESEAPEVEVERSMYGIVATPLHRDRAFADSGN